MLCACVTVKGVLLIGRVQEACVCWDRAADPGAEREHV